MAKSLFILFLAIILSIFIVVFFSFTMYHKIKNPQFFICDHTLESVGHISLPTKISDGIFSYTYINLPSCKDGVFAHNLPFFGKLYKYDLIIGLILIFVAVLYSIGKHSFIRMLISDFYKKKQKN